MLGNLNSLLDLFYKVQTGESLSVVEVFAVVGTLGAIAGSIWTIFSLTYLAVRISKSGFRVFFKPLGDVALEAIKLLQSEETVLAKSNVLVSGLLTVVLNDARRWFGEDESNILLDGEFIEHLTSAERKAILSTARSVRKEILKQQKLDARFAAVLKMRGEDKVTLKLSDADEVKVDDKFIETAEILEMLCKRYGINLEKNNFKENCENHAGYPEAHPF